MEYDFFNGDADGIISLHQYRMLVPNESVKFTGVKRDVELLRHVLEQDICHQLLNVFDVSMKSNHIHIIEALRNCNHMRWFDHHDPGDFDYGNDVRSVIDTDPNTCTAIIVDEYISRKYTDWTIAAAYGDNLHKTAKRIGSHLSDEQHQTLKHVGEVINYNGYGRTEQDLIAHPLDVFNDLHEYVSPFEYADTSELFAKIDAQMLLDQDEVNNSVTLLDKTFGKVVRLPDSISSIRYSGIYSNQLATDNPDMAFVILTTVPHGYRASIRAPLNRPTGAGALASQFNTGGGREKAAGINLLKEDQLETLFDKFEQAFG